MAIHSPGFLRFFERGPFTLASFKEGKLDVDVPQPGILAVAFQPAGSADELPFENAMFSLMRKLPDGGSGSYLMAGTSPLAAPWAPVELSDLAPGEYRLILRTAAKPGIANLPDAVYTPINPGVFTAHKKSVLLSPGQTEKVDFAYTPLDLEAFRGDRTAASTSLNPTIRRPLARRSRSLTTTGIMGP